MKKIIVYFFAFCYFLSSCEKDVTEKELLLTPDEGEFILEKGKKALTDDEKKFRKKLEKTAFKLIAVADDKEAIEPIQSGINRSVEYLQDEEIRFIDIFSESDGASVKKQAIDSYSTLSHKLKQVFENENQLKSGSDPFKNMDKWLTKNDIIIYWPYMDNWDGEKMITITFDPIDNDDVNYGFLKVPCNKKKFKVDTVVVNEEYAINNPVWIIRKAEVPYEELDYKSKRVPTKRISPDDPYPSLPEDPYPYLPIPDPNPDPDPEPPTGREINRVLLGRVWFGKQYDGLFQGGPEFKFHFLKGEVNLNQTTMGSAESTLGVTLKRSDKYEWIQYFQEFDDDWNVKELDRGFALGEYDSGGTEVTFGFTPKVKIKVSEAVELEVSAPSVSVKIKNEDRGGWIKTDSWARDIFMNNNKKDMGFGTYDGYRVFRADFVKWTLPVETYYLD